MNRNEIEKHNENVTAEYTRMLEEMVKSSTSESFSDNDSGSYYYLKLEEVSNRWIADEKPIWNLMTNFFIGLYSVKAPFSIVLKGNNSGLSVYVGSTIDRVEIMSRMLIGTIPQIKYRKNDGSGYSIFQFSDINCDNKCVYGGVLKGNPTGNENYKNSYQIDAVIKGMKEKSWIVSIFAQPVIISDTFTRQQQWMTQAAGNSIFSELNYSETDGLETTSYKQRYFHSEQLSKKITSFCERITDCISSGEWCTTINFVSDSDENAHLLGGLLTSAFYGEESEPEPVHAIYNINHIYRPIVNGIKYMQSSYCDMQYPKYSTMLSSRELAVYAALPTIDTYGFSVADYVDFNVDRNDDGDLKICKILDSQTVTNNEYCIDSNELNRHCLVVGLTGSGKTNTIKNLIYKLTKKSEIPFIVIEPAKKEYWDIYKLGFEDLQIYSVGSNEKNSHNLCINPFERASFTDLKGIKHYVPIQTHIDFVFAAFKASFIMYTPMPYVLEKAIYEIYEDCGWDIHRDYNPNGDVYPTMEDLFFKIEDVVEANGFDDRMKNDLIGSLQARINSMRLGSKGDTLNVERSYDLDKIFNGHVIVELEDIGDDDVKAFIISVLLILLLEYRRQQEDAQLELKHLMIIEEAHRLLKNVQSGTGENADPRGAAVEFFCNLLAELRSKGQGFLVADQIPSKLAPDLIKNTNLKIVHRTVAEEERVLIGGSMHMTDEQIDYIASLKQGVAAVYSEGDNRPILVKPDYAGDIYIDEYRNYSRTDVLARTYDNVPSNIDKSDYSSLTDRQNKLCHLCNKHCQKRYQDILKHVDSDSFVRLANSLNPHVTKSCKAFEIDDAIREYLTDAFDASFAGIISNRICIANNLIAQWKLENHLVKVIIRYYTALKKGE